MLESLTPAAVLNIVALAVMAGTVYVAFRHGQNKAKQEAGAQFEATRSQLHHEMQALLATRAAEIDTLKGRLSVLEDQLRGITGLYTEAMRTVQQDSNTKLMLHSRIDALTAENQTLRATLAARDAVPVSA